MTDNLRESISALMDDEANELEIHRLLSSKEEGDEVRNTWKRYQLASFAMKGQLPKHIDIDISQRVAEAIADEGLTYEAGTAVNSTGWSKVLRPVASMAVAASVAFLVVFGALQINQPVSGPQSAEFTQSTSMDATSQFASTIESQDASVLAANADSLTPTQKKLRALIDTHTQQADLSRGRAFMPYAQLVSDGDSQRY